jgi:hypothetical protein
MRLFATEIHILGRGLVIQPRHEKKGAPRAIPEEVCWVASGVGDEARLWPIPDLSKTPLQFLPREELITKLKTLTNLRVIRDVESPTGWELTHDPFLGWEAVSVR